METRPHAKANAAESRNEKLTCWQTGTNPQCLRVETESEIHLFAYGYFRRACFLRKGHKETIEIYFQDVVIVVKGKSLESLCDALSRLGIERIRPLPEKYSQVSKDGVITEIEVRQNEKRASSDVLSDEENPST